MMNSSRQSGKRTAMLAAEAQWMLEEAQKRSGAVREYFKCRFEREVCGKCTCYRVLHLSLSTRLKLVWKLLWEANE